MMFALCFLQVKPSTVDTIHCGYSEHLTLGQVHVRLASCADWLIVIDNIEMMNPPQQDKYKWFDLLPRQAGHCLMLTQSSTCATQVLMIATALIELQPLAQAETALLLATLTGRSDVADKVRCLSSSTLLSVRDFTQQDESCDGPESEVAHVMWLSSPEVLAGMPIAVHHLARFINTANLTFQQAAEALYKSLRQEDYQPTVAGRTAAEATHSTGLSHIQTHFTRLMAVVSPRLSSQAYMLLLVLAYFSAQHIPITLANKVVKHLPGYSRDAADESPQQLYCLISQLREFSLVSFFCQNSVCSSVQIPTEYTIQQQPITLLPHSYLRLPRLLQVTIQEIITLSLEQPDHHLHALANWSVSTAVSVMNEAILSHAGIVMEVHFFPHIRSTVQYCAPRLLQAVTHRISDGHTSAVTGSRSAAYCTLHGWSHLLSVAHRGNNKGIDPFTTFSVAYTGHHDIFRTQSTSQGDVISHAVQGAPPLDMQSLLRCQSEAVREVCFPVSGHIQDMEKLTTMTNGIAGIKRLPRHARRLCCHLVWTVLLQPWILTVVSRAPSLRNQSSELDSWQHYFQHPYRPSGQLPVPATDAHSGQKNSESAKLKDAVEAVHQIALFAITMITKLPNETAVMRDSVKTVRQQFEKAAQLLYDDFPKFAFAAATGEDHCINDLREEYQASPGPAETGRTVKISVLILRARQETKPILHGISHEIFWCHCLLADCLLHLLGEKGKREAILVFSRMTVLLQKHAVLQHAICDFAVLLDGIICNDTATTLAMSLQVENQD